MIDIVEELRGYEAPDMAWFCQLNLDAMLHKAADTIAQLRYDHERDVEKIAGLRLQLEQHGVRVG